MKIERRDINCERVDGIPGRYRVTRDLTVDGHPYSAALECANPAFGERILDNWERKTLERIAAAEQKAA